VICGLAITDYEHIDPPFAEARVHDPKKIALLCPSCHARVTRGLWSKDTVLTHRRNPKTFKNGYAKDAFDFKPPFHLFVGDNHFQDIRCIVRKSSGEEWFTVEPPEVSEGPPRLSAKFFGPSGSTDLEILQNEWRCSTDVWDLRITGSLIEIRGAQRLVTLRLEAKPPHGLKIRSLHMMFKDTGIVVKNDGTVLLIASGSEIEMNTSDVSRADTIFSVP
jgi:hypothetical protein